MTIRRMLFAAACAAIAASSVAVAQDSATEKAIEKYRQMLKEDPWSNPGLLDADRGEALWTTSRGPKNTSLEQCDLGKGAGNVDGAFAELPRYFADADRVMDLETRILWCMEKLQGLTLLISSSGRIPALGSRSRSWAPWPLTSPANPAA